MSDDPAATSDKADRRAIRKAKEAGAAFDDTGGMDIAVTTYKGSGWRRQFALFKRVYKMSRREFNRMDEMQAGNLIAEMEFVVEWEASLLTRVMFGDGKTKGNKPPRRPPPPR